MGTYIAIVLRADGEVEVVMLKNATFNRLREVIHCEMAELIPLDEDAALLVDEEGFDKPVNDNASQLSGRVVKGDVMIVSMEHLDELPYE